MAFPCAAFAQSCAMCATAASSAKAAALVALRNGILILLIPPVLMFIGIFTLAFRKRDTFNDGNVLDAGLDRELKDWLARMEPIEPCEGEASRAPTSQDPCRR